MLIEVFIMFAMPNWLVPLTMWDHVVGAASEGSVMLEVVLMDSYVIPLSFLFSMGAKEVKCFYHHIQEVRKQVWRRVFSKLSSNSMRFVLRHVNKNVLLLCNFAR